MEKDAIALHQLSEGIDLPVAGFYSAEEVIICWSAWVNW
jgi:hypothetical protein